MWTTPVAIASALLLTALGCSSGLKGSEGSFDGFVDSGGTSIHYEVDLPAGDGPFTTIVYGPGSGNLPASHKNIVARTEQLLRLGFAVARYNKRGTGQSEGEIPKLNTGNSDTVIPQLAADMKAVLRAVQRHEEIAPDRMALFGVSQAAWYLPLVAAEVEEVQFMIVLSGGLTPVGPENFWEFQVFINERDPFALETLEVWRTYDGPTGFDQRPLVRDLDRPMLYLIGESDRVVPVQPFLEEVEPLQKSGVDITFHTYPQGGHGLNDIDYWGDVRTWLAGL